MTILGIDPGIATVGYGVIQYENGRFRMVELTLKTGLKSYITTSAS